MFEDGQKKKGVVRLGEGGLLATPKLFRAASHAERQR